MKWTIAIGAVVAAIRIWMGLNVEPQSLSVAQVYKDIAHLFMGGLFVAWWIQRHRWQWLLFWALNAVEIAAIIWSRI